MVERRKLPVPPRMEIDNIAVLWGLKEISRHYWRVAEYIEYDDLVQLIYFHWYRIVMGQLQRGARQRGEAVSQMHSYKYCTDRRQIMALFQRTFIQHLTDLANGRTNSAPFDAIKVSRLGDDEGASIIDCTNFSGLGMAGPASATTPYSPASIVVLQQAAERGPQLDEEACLDIIDVLMSINGPRNQNMVAEMLVGYIKTLANAAPHIFSPIAEDLKRKVLNSDHLARIAHFFDDMRRRHGRHVSSAPKPSRRVAADAV